MRRIVRIALVAGVLLFAVAAHARPTPEEKCQAGKNIAAGRFAKCLQNAEGKLAATGDQGKYAQAKLDCSYQFATKWVQSERSAARAGVTCPDAPLEQSALEAAIAQCSASVATALAGSGLADCTTALATCTGDLGTCNGDLGTCNGDLGTCAANLAQTASDLTTCNGTVTTLSGNLTTCTGSLGTCTSNLATANGSLSACNGSLGTCNGDLTTCNANVTTLTGDLSTCNGSLGMCDASLATCTTDLATCIGGAPQGQRLKTEQTTCYNTAGTEIACAGTGQDGELRKGLARAYTDNGDGTITDMKTGLMWEKHSDDGSIHDKDTTYTWTNAFAVKVAGLNGGGGFAGHTDWRVPNVNELQSLVSNGAVTPSVNAAFNMACAATCTVTTCSCTQSDVYWSATTSQGGPAGGWIVNFFDGSVGGLDKLANSCVRGVRGGS